MSLSLILHSLQVPHPSYNVLATALDPVCGGRDSQLATQVAQGFPNADTRETGSTEAKGNLAHVRTWVRLAARRRLGSTGPGERSRYRPGGDLDIGQSPVYTRRGPSRGLWFMNKRLGPGILRVHAFEDRTSHVSILRNSAMRRTFSYWAAGKWCGTEGKSAPQYNIITEVLVLRTVLGAPAVATPIPPRLDRDHGRSGGTS